MCAATWARLRFDLQPIRNFRNLRGVKGCIIRGIVSSASSDGRLCRIARCLDWAYTRVLRVSSSFWASSSMSVIELSQSISSWCIDDFPSFSTFWTAAADGSPALLASSSSPPLYPWLTTGFLTVLGGFENLFASGLFFLFFMGGCTAGEVSAALFGGRPTFPFVALSPVDGIPVCL